MKEVSNYSVGGFQSFLDCFFQLVITITDGGTPTPLFIDVTVAIAVQSENEFAPNHNGPYVATIKENQAIFTTFLTLAPDDDDLDANGDNQAVTCHLQGQLGISI